MSMIGSQASLILVYNYISSQKTHQSYRGTLQSPFQYKQWYVVTDVLQPDMNNS